MSGCRCDARSWDRNDRCCRSWSGCRFRRRSGCRTEGRLGGKDSPSRLGDGNSPGRSQKSEARCLKSEVPEPDLRFTVYGARLQGERCTKKRAVLRFGVVVSLIPVRGFAPRRATDAMQDLSHAYRATRTGKVPVTQQAIPDARAGGFRVHGEGKRTEGLATLSSRA